MNWFIKVRILTGFIASVLLVQSCNLIRIREDEVEKEEPLARVYDKYLYETDLQGLYRPGMNIEDSAMLVEKFIKDWARKQILIEEASTKINFDEAEIERKVLDYRFSLMGYQYQRSYIQQNLNRDVSEEEIKKYYDENLDNFVLKENIIRGKYLKIPITAPNTRKLKRLIRSDKEEDFEELKSYCLSFASAYQLYDSVWMVFEDIVKDTPLADIPNKVQYLRSNRYVESVDENFLYFILIVEYRISDNISPLEFVKDQIRNIILNKRKVELAKKLEDDVYQKAVEQKEFEIFY